MIMERVTFCKHIHCIKALGVGRVYILFSGDKTFKNEQLLSVDLQKIFSLTL